MPYNLLQEQWIPVRDAEGNTWDIAPHEMTEPGPYGTVPVALNAPRPDFNGALIQFLIGLVQTACPPETERAWRHWFKQPPKAHELREYFKEYDWAFYLDENPVDGEKGLFMQDYHFVIGHLEDTPKDDNLDIVELLIDSGSGSNTYFNKARARWQFGPRVSAMALFTLQTHAPSGGRGHRASLRGESPVTAIVLGNTLWQTAWLNVLIKADFEASGAASQHSDEPQAVFPWLAPSRTSEHGQTTTREDVHPLQMYWAMPVRVKMRAIQQLGPCAVEGKVVQAPYVSFARKNLGINYVEPWEHPLTPYQRLSDGTTKALKGQLGAITYQNWAGLVINDNRNGIHPARVVRLFRQRSAYHSVSQALGSRNPMLWIFGYEMESKKARRWHESQMPLFLVSPDIREDFEDFAHDLVSAASLLTQGETSSDPCLKLSLKRGLFGSYQKKEGKVKWDLPASKKEALAKSAIEDTAARFWRDTEPWFYDRLREAQQALTQALGQEKALEESLVDLRKAWAEDLQKYVIDLYDQVTGYGTFRGADPKAVAKARIDLDGFANWKGEGGKKFREALHLPAPQKKKSKQKRG